MKTILVPTDFSKTAGNAVNYAAEVAKRIKAKIVLLHVYHIPVTTAEAPVIIPVWEDIEKDCMASLKKISRGIHRMFGTALEVKCVCRVGFAVDEIIEQYSEESEPTLIIMGMNGAGYLGEKLLGSNATELIKRSKCPVLVINEKVKFKLIKKIALAYDYKYVPDAMALEPLKRLIRVFKSKLFIVNVVEDLKKLPSTEKAANGVGFEQLLEGINHYFFFMENKNTINGVNEFLANKNVDMVVFIPQVHSFPGSLFHKSSTKEMAFHTTIPMLALQTK